MSSLIDSEIDPILANSESFPKRSRRNYYLEPGVFLLCLGYNLSPTVLVRFLLIKTCEVSLNFNRSDCLLMSTANQTDDIKEIEERSQKYVAEIEMTISMIRSVIPAILVLILGPYSDKFGRKCVIISAFLGATIYYGSVTCLSILSDFYKISPWFFALSIIFFTLMGDFSVILTVILSYITDISTEKQRSTRIAVIEMMLGFGFMAGSLISSCLVSIMTSYEIFFTSFACIATSTIYIFNVLEESIEISAEDQALGLKDRLSSMFCYDTIKDITQTCLKQREGNKRKILWLMMIMLMLIVFIARGSSSSLIFLYEQRQFSWTVKDSSLYDSAAMLKNILGSIAGLFILKRLLKLADINVVVISVTCDIIADTVLFFSKFGWEMYVAAGITLMSALFSPMSRGLVSQMVENVEIGKVFAFTTALESITGLVASPIYTLVYNLTMETFPGAFFGISVLVYLMILLIAIYVRKLQKPSKDIIG